MAVIMFAIIKKHEGLDTVLNVIKVYISYLAF